MASVKPVFSNGYNRGHWFWAALKAGFVFNEKGLVPLPYGRQAAGFSLFAAFDTQPAATQTLRKVNDLTGPSLFLTGATRRLQGALANVNFGTDYAAVMGFTNTTAGTSIVMTEFDGGSASNFLFDLSSAGFRHRAGGGTTTATAITYGLNEPHVFSLNRRGATVEMHLDGVPVFRQTNFSGGALSLGSLGSAASASTGKLSFLYLLDPVELGAIRQLLADPFAPFRPARRGWRLSAGGVAFDAAANSGYQAAASTYTFARTCTGSNRFLAVDVALLSAGQTVLSVIDDDGGGNVPMTLIGARSTVSSVGRVECWGLAAPASGTKNITVTLSGAIASSAEAVSYTGVEQTSPYEAFNSNQATNVGAADATVAVTPVADKCWIHAALATNDAAVTAGQTSRNNVTGAGGSGADEDTGPISPAAQTTMSYTAVDALQTWVIAGYAIRPVAAGPIAGASSFHGWGPLFGLLRNRLVRI